MASRSVDDIVTVLAAGGDDYGSVDGPPGCSLLEHALDCAERLRSRFPGDVELQVAGLVHDIGRTLTVDDERASGLAAAMFVRPVLGDRIARLVELHVAAGRYLSGAMSAEEATGFELLPDVEAALALRRACEGAMRSTVPVTALASWHPALIEVAATHA